MNTPPARPIGDLLPWMAVFFVLGILATGWGAGAALFLIAIGRVRGDARVVALGACLLAGGVRGGVEQATRPADGLADLVGRPLIMRGVVQEPEIVGCRGCRFVLRVREVAWRGGSRRTDARVLVGVTAPTRDAAPAHWTQEVVVSGALEHPPTLDGFDYAGWLAERDIFEVVRLRSAADVTVCGRGEGPPWVRAAARVRRGVERALEAWLPPLEASLAEGVLLAESRGIPDEVTDAFRTTGTFHVLVTAGIHVAFVTAGCIAGLGLLGVGGARAALLTIPAVAFFALVAGASPSIVRAAIMGGVALVGHAAGRPSSGRRALSLAVLCMTAWNPRLVGDAGFRMSVACVVGILHLAPLLRSRLGWLPAALRGPVAISASTQVMIAPLSALYFGHVSLTGVVANLVVVPLCEVLLALGLLVGTLGACAETLAAAGPWATTPLVLLARPLAVAAWLDGRLVVAAVRAFGDLPWCVVQVSPPDGREIVLWYAGVWAAAKLAARIRVPENEVAPAAHARNGGSA